MQPRVGREPVRNAVRPRVAFRPKPSALLGAAPRSTPRRFPRTLRRSGRSGVPWPPCVPTCVDPPGGGRRLRRDSSRRPSAPPRPLAPALRAFAPQLPVPRAGRSLLGSTPCGVLLTTRLLPRAACGALRIRWRHFADSQHNRQENFSNFRHLWITCGHSCGDTVDGVWVTAVTLWTARQQPRLRAAGRVPVGSVRGVLVSAERFEELVAEALDGIPPELGSKMDNVQCSSCDHRIGPGRRRAHPRRDAGPQPCRRRPRADDDAAAARQPRRANCPSPSCAPG